MTKFLMCRPTYFDVVYEINPWMNSRIQVDRRMAKDQWDLLYRTILECGGEVDLINPVAGLPDMVFTANSALVNHNKVYLSRFKHPERQGEIAYFKNWFLQHGYQIFGGVDGPYFEGTGDALFVGDTLFCGYGIRSDSGIYDHLQDLDIQKKVLCKLVDKRFYHLDTCFCPLNESSALWFPNAFDEESRERMQQEKQLIAISEAEAMKFAANTVIVGEHAILPGGCTETAQLLTEHGFTSHLCPMTEFLKSGGACNCLTLELR